MFAHIARHNFQSMILGTGLAFLFISLLLLVAFKSLRLGLVSIVPDLVPAIMGFGVWGLLVGKVGMSLSVVGSLTLGIVVDDTVHFLSKYRRARFEHSKDAEDSVRYAFSTVGTALWVSTFVLVIGFAILALSPFKVNAMLGLMVALTVACALIIDFLLLPSLLIALDRRKKAANPKLEAASSAPAE